MQQCPHCGGDISSFVNTLIKFLWQMTPEDKKEWEFVRRVFKHKQDSQKMGTV